jgi:hypothetical protein
MSGNTLPAQGTPEFDPGLPNLEQILLDVTFAPNRAIDPSTQDIPLDTLQARFDDLRKKSDLYTHPAQPGQYAEYGILITIPDTLRTSLNFEQEGITGLGSTYRPHVPRTFNHNLDARGYSVVTPTQYIATAPHSHWDGSILSPTDLVTILTDDLFTSETAASSFTDDELTFAFRGPQTPALTPQSAEAQMQQVDDAITQETFTRIVAQEQQDRKPMSPADQHALGRAIAREYLINTVAPAYNLQLFSCKVGSTMLTRMTT